MNRPHPPTLSIVATALGTHGPWQRPRPGHDAPGETWRRQVPAANLAWGRLTEEELLSLEGHAGKLIRLLQERYGVTREIAASQVQSFFMRPPF